VERQHVTALGKDAGQFGAQEAPTSSAGSNELAKSIEGQPLPTHHIFLHHVLDKWFEDVVRPRMKGKATLVRFADDFVMTFETHYDAKRVMDVLGNRLGRFGLKLHPDKTRFIALWWDAPRLHGAIVQLPRLHSLVG
jgi:hypothetical protein